MELSNELRQGIIDFINKRMDKKENFFVWGRSEYGTLWTTLKWHENVEIEVKIHNSKSVNVDQPIESYEGDFLFDSRVTINILNADELYNRAFVLMKNILIDKVKKIDFPNCNIDFGESCMELVVKDGSVNMIVSKSRDKYNDRILNFDLLDNKTDFYLEEHDLDSSNFTGGDKKYLLELKNYLFKIWGIHRKGLNDHLLSVLSISQYVGLDDNDKEKDFYEQVSLLPNWDDAPDWANYWIIVNDKFSEKLLVFWLEEKPSGKLWGEEIKNCIDKEHHGMGLSKYDFSDWERIIVDRPTPVAKEEVLDEPNIEDIEEETNEYQNTERRGHNFSWHQS